MKRVMKKAAIALLITGVVGVSYVPSVGAEVRDTPKAEWKVWGGEASFRWNRTLLEEYGIHIRSSGAAPLDDYSYERVAVRSGSTLNFNVDSGSFVGFTQGILSFAGGFIIQTPQGEIDLRQLRMVPRANDPFVLDVIGEDGQAWFYIDRLMYEVEGGDLAPVLAIKAADIRLSEAFAAKVGMPHLAAQAVADLHMVNSIHSEGARLSEFAPRGSTRWPGAPVSGTDPQQYYQADVFMHHFDNQKMRQGDDSAFDPDGGLKVVIAPSSTLRNNRNNGSLGVTVPCVVSPCPSGTTGLQPDPLGESAALYAADIPWFQKFSGAYSPYGNDQHPYLIWNLYRIDADGRIEQIGRSGVKHAWLTTNTSCDSNPGDGHILGRGCTDTYSTGNNDAIGDLGPREEIIPSTGQWGRCKSVFDRDCNGARDSQSPCSNLPTGNTSACQNWAFRLTVPAGQLMPANYPNATYWMESWYIVRDDINIYNTMQTRPVTFSLSGTSWLISNRPMNELALGPAIDRWMPRGTSTSTELSTDINTRQGQARLATRVTELPNGKWRYDYVVANFDYMQAKTAGDELNLEIISNIGFVSFGVPSSSASALTELSFSDGDEKAANNWQVTTSSDEVTWLPVADQKNNLDWGTMFRFSLVSDEAPVSGDIKLGVFGRPALDVAALIPGTGVTPQPLLIDGFEAVLEE